MRASAKLATRLASCLRSTLAHDRSKCIVRTIVCNTNQHAETAYFNPTAASHSVAAAEKQPDAGSSASAENLTNHPLDYDPVTNEHTANMTMARAAALEYYQAGKYRQAEAKFLEALKEAQLGFDAKDPHIASCQNNLAEFYRNTGQYDKAEELYKQALAHLEAAYGEKHWLYVSAMHNLALMHESRGNLQLAQSTMERVLRLRLQMFGPKHFLYADSMFALAHILRKLGGHDKQVLNLMRDAVAILEDSENVQVQVVLVWLPELAEECKRQGRLGEAAAAIRKAMYHLTNDKGEAFAQASQLNDTLVNLLLESGKLLEAHDAMQAGVNARTSLFGKSLVVAQSLVKLATIEAQLGKPEATTAAQQNASNAASLCEELLQEYSRAKLGRWLGTGGSNAQNVQLKRMQAAHILASALSLLSSLHTVESEAPLQRAVEVLQQGLAVARGQMEAASKPGAKVDIDELTSLYVEMQLLLLECLDKLIEKLRSRSGDAAAAEQVQALQQQATALAEFMLQQR